MVVNCKSEVAAVFEAQRDFICSVGHIDQLALGAEQDKPANSVSVADAEFEAFIVLGDLVDFSAEAARVKKELTKAQKDLASVTRTLGNEGFVAKAAPAVVEKKRAQKAELEATIQQLEAQAEDFS